MRSPTRIWVYKRITLVLILCIVAMFSFKISLSPSVLKMAYTADFRNRKWLGFAGNDSYRQTTTSYAPKNHTSSDLTRTTTLNIRNIHDPFKGFVTDWEKNQTSSNINKHSSDESFIINHKPILSKEETKSSKILKSLDDKNFTSKMSSGKYKPEDLMTVGPFHFLKNYKNPCWVPERRNSTDPPIRCLPYFYLIGAPKSGTTDLHRRLIQHPDISRLVVKEPHWITRRHFYSPAKRKKRSTFEDYLKIFTFATREIYMKRDASGYHSIIFGDCSASTMWDNDYWRVLPEFRNLSEPVYTNADYIHHLNPNTKIIAMLRNPIDRLYSDYLYFHHGSPELFHKGVLKAINETHSCLRSNSLRHCLYTPPGRDTRKVRLRIGVYHLHLKEYFRIFPREQVMVIKLEDFSKKTAPYMQKVFAFLDIPELRIDDLQRIADPEKHANPRRKKDKIAGEMLPETRSLLKAFYQPHNELLIELLGEQFNYNRDSVS